MGNPLGHSILLDRTIRQDGIETLGISSLTLAERAAADGDRALAMALVGYFWEEMVRMGAILFTWMESIYAFRMLRMGMEPADLPGKLLDGIRSYDPSQTDREHSIARLEQGDVVAGLRSADVMRMRYAVLHDAYVAWIQALLAGIAADHGEEAVRESVEYAGRTIWEPRYVVWAEMTPLERLQLSVEGMRGHLSGMGRRGDVGIIEEADRYVMVLDPCGSCGILRRGDPETGRKPARPAGNLQPHPWTWGRTGMGWYAVHSPIAMEYVHMRAGGPPLRPLEDCDTERACRWFVYKDMKGPRAEHYLRMGFTPPGAGE
jgi:hypothetical protein